MPEDGRIHRKDFVIYVFVYIYILVLQAFIVNDVDISPGPKSLLFDKHIEYIANHGNDKDDYVCIDCDDISIRKYEEISVLIYLAGILYDGVSSHVWHILGNHRSRSVGSRG